MDVGFAGGGHGRRSVRHGVGLVGMAKAFPLIIFTGYNVTLKTPSAVSHCVEYLRTSTLHVPCLAYLIRSTRHLGALLLARRSWSSEISE